MHIVCFNLLWLTFWSKKVWLQSHGGKKNNPSFHFYTQHVALETSTHSWIRILCIISIRLLVLNLHLGTIDQKPNWRIKIAWMCGSLGKPFTWSSSWHFVPKSSEIRSWTGTRSFEITLKDFVPVALKVPLHFEPGWSTELLANSSSTGSEFSLYHLFISVRFRRKLHGRLWSLLARSLVFTISFWLRVLLMSLLLAF